MAKKRKVINAKDLNTNELVYFNGHAKTTYMSDNVTVEDAIKTKQDIISDLDTIRNGAALGATALQAVPEEYITETELNQKGYLTEHQDISGKQDNLISGTNIKTVNGESLLGEGNLNISNFTEITYSELKNLRDNSQLTPGKIYRITDYVTTSIQTETRSANHPFDIIVTAIDDHTLSHLAKAALHEGDTYFSDCNISAWELKYCLDNDTTKYLWADEENGKGVIYYMKDEYENECPYDFKNIQYKRFKLTLSDTFFSYVKSKVEQYYVGRSGIPNTSILDTNDYTWYYTFNMMSNDENKDASLLCIDNVIQTKQNIINDCPENEAKGGFVRKRLNNIVICSNTTGVAEIVQNTFTPLCNNITLMAYNTTGETGICSNYFDLYSTDEIFMAENLIYSNYIKSNSKYNIIYTKNIQLNRFYNYFQRNIMICNDSFEKNVLDYVFHNNKFIINEFINNSTKEYFKDNTIKTNSFSNNNIGSYFYNNIINITTDFNFNYIKQWFSDNIINVNEFSNNDIDKDFYENNINMTNGFSQNKLGWRFSNNEINGYRFINNVSNSLCQYNIFPSEFVGNIMNPAFRYNVFKVSNDLTSLDRNTVKYCNFGSYVLYNNFYNTSSSENVIQNLKVQSNLQGSSESYNHIEVPVGASGEIIISKNSNNEIKVYNIADLIN